MKIRTNYVSNSSSSSFVIAYDESFFGDLLTLIQTSHVGCETSVTNHENMEEFYECRFSTLEEINNFKQKVEEKINQGKKVILLELDSEYEFLIKLLNNINKNNGEDKIEFLYK